MFMDSAQDNIIIYRPNQRHELGYVQTLVVMTKNVIRSRDLIWQLFKRDYFATYKKSFLGVTWVVVAPILGIVSWVFLKKAGLLNPGDVGIPYPAYVLIGTSMWGLFMGFFTSSSQTLSSVSRLVMMANFPREAILFKQTAIHLTNFAVTLMLSIVVLVVFGIIPSAWSVLFPFVVLPLFFLGASLGLIVSMISIVAVDLKKLINALMGLLLFMTPVIYSDKIDSVWVKYLIKWNPLTYLVCSARDIIVYGRLYDIEGFLICAFISFFLFVISCRLFYVSEDKIIERMI